MPRWSYDERREIFRGSGGKCHRCGRKHTLSRYNRDWNVDHVLPRSHKGPDASYNLEVACIHCNSSKGNNFDEVDRATLIANKTVDKMVDRFGDNFPRYDDGGRANARERGGGSSGGGHSDNFRQGGGRNAGGHPSGSRQSGSSNSGGYSGNSRQGNGRNTGSYSGGSRQGGGGNNGGYSGNSRQGGGRNSGGYSGGSRQGDGRSSGGYYGNSRQGNGRNTGGYSGDSRQGGGGNSGGYSGNSRQGSGHSNGGYSGGHQQDNRRSGGHRQGGGNFRQEDKKPEGRRIQKDFDKCTYGSCMEKKENYDGFWNGVWGQPIGKYCQHHRKQYEQGNLYK